MNDAIARMLDRYACQSVEDYVRALREIMQEIALLGLWRSRFFEKAAFYGGTAANHPQLHLGHLEQRMIQSGYLKKGEHLNREIFFALTAKTVDKLDVDQARREVEPFVKNPEALEVWSMEFFQDVVRRIALV